jgi:hypothetical protein
MAAIDTVLTLADEIGLTTDDLCEAIAYLAAAEEIERWTLDDITADDITVTSHSLKNIQIKCSTDEGLLHIVLDIRGSSITVVDEWSDASTGREDY